MGVLRFRQALRVLKPQLIARRHAQLLGFGDVGFERVDIAEHVVDHLLKLRLRQRRRTRAAFERGRLAHQLLARRQVRVLRLRLGVLVKHLRRDGACLRSEHRAALVTFRRVQHVRRSEHSE